MGRVNWVKVVLSFSSESHTGELKAGVRIKSFVNEDDWLGKDLFLRHILGKL